MSICRSPLSARLLLALALMLMARTASADPRPQDLQPLIDRAIAQRDSELVIPPGEYRLTPPTERAPHLKIHGADGLRIVADGVTLVCTKLNQAIDIANCRGLTLQGLTIDHDPLPFTQGTVQAVSPDRRFLDVRLDAGYPALGDRIRASIWDARGERIKPGTWTRFGGAFQTLPDGVVSFDQGRPFTDGVTPGDRIVFSNAYTTAHGIIVRDCSNTVIREVTLHASTCFGILENDGDGNRYEGVRITPGPPPAGASQPRILSTLADGFHSKFARRGPTVQDCLFERMGDDGIAINGDFMLVADADASTAAPSLTLAFKRKLGLAVGDRVLARNRATGVPTGEARIVAVEPADAAVTATLPALVAQHLPELRERESFKQAWRFTLDGPIHAAAGDLAASPDRTGAGFVVRGNTIRNHRARGILVKAPEGVIEGNTIEGSSMSGIVLSPEVEMWMEADFSHDVMIRGNTVRDVNLSAPNPGSMFAGAISVTAPSLTPAGGHRRITIENNVVEGGAGPALLVTSADTVTIRGNRFVGTHQLPGGHGSSHGVPADSAMHLARVSGVTLDNNTMIQPGPHAGPLLTRDDQP